MKLFIEDENARSSSIGERYLPPRVEGDRVMLDICPEPQEMECWCWAALAAAAGRYFRTRALSQCEIAGAVLRLPCCGPGSDACNRDRSLKEALALVDCFSHWSPAKPVFERIMFEINLGRPLFARVEWYTGGAHFVLIRGYKGSRRMLMIEDTIHGPSLQPYADFPKNYRVSGGIWTETYWTNKN